MKQSICDHNGNKTVKYNPSVVQLYTEFNYYKMCEREYIERKPDFVACEQQSADQLAHSRCLISAFVIRNLGRMIAKLGICNISRF